MTSVIPHTLHSTGNSQYLLLQIGQKYPPVEKRLSVVSK